MDRKKAATLAVTGVAAAALAGSRNGPSGVVNALWYELLRKPEQTPPGPAIGATWITLEGLLAASGYRLLRARRSPARRLSLIAWAGTLAGLAAYPWLFFARKRLGASTLVSAAMLGTAVTLAGAAREADPPAAAMSLPLVAWLAGATLLNVALWRDNAWLSCD